MSTQRYLTVPMTKLWDVNSGKCLRTWDAVLDVDVLATAFCRNAIQAPQSIACNRLQEFQIIVLPREELVAAIPSEYNAEWCYHEESGTIVGCDWQHLYLYRLVRANRMGLVVKEHRAG